MHLGGSLNALKHKAYVEDEKIVEVTDSCFKKLSDMLKLKMY